MVRPNQVAIRSGMKRSSMVERVRTTFSDQHRATCLVKYLLPQNDREDSKREGRFLRSEGSEPTGHGRLHRVKARIRGLQQVPHTQSIATNEWSFHMPVIVTMLTTVGNTETFRVEREPVEILRDFESFLSTGSPKVVEGTDFKKGKKGARARRPEFKVSVDLKDVISVRAYKVT